MNVSMTVNGRSVSGDVEPRTLLVHFIRENLHLTGTHVGCETGYCGACTVLIDDVPHYACSVLTHTVRNRAVTTIEGLEGHARSAERRLGG